MPRKKRGPGRLAGEILNAAAGLRRAWKETAPFRAAACLSLAAVVADCALARTFAEFALLALPGSIWLATVLLGGAVESCSAGFSKERQPLSKKAKELVCAARFVACCFFLLVWGMYLVSRW